MPNPLASPGWRLERVGEILGLVHHLTAAELHNAHRVRVLPLIRNGIFRNPDVTPPKNSLNLEAGRFAGMMTPQSLQILSSEDALARLGIVANRVVVVDIVFCVDIAVRRRAPVGIQGFKSLSL